MLFLAVATASSILSSVCVYQGLRNSQVRGPEWVCETLISVFLPTRVETKDRKSHVISAMLFAPDSITKTVA